MKRFEELLNDTVHAAARLAANFDSEKSAAFNAARLALVEYVREIVKQRDEAQSGLAGWQELHSPGPIPECMTIADAIEGRWMNSDGTPCVLDVKNEVPR